MNLKLTIPADKRSDKSFTSQTPSRIQHCKQSKGDARPKKCSCLWYIISFKTQLFSAGDLNCKCTASSWGCFTGTCSNSADTWHKQHESHLHISLGVTSSVFTTVNGRKTVLSCETSMIFTLEQEGSIILMTQEGTQSLESDLLRIVMYNLFSSSWSTFIKGAVQI